MSEELARQVWALSQEMAPQLAEIRQRIHKQPELGFQEIETARLVAQRLRELSLEVHEGVAQTGVVGLLRGKAADKAVGLRADMDALPIQEKSTIPYRSQKPCVMHACGHDAHVACLLGAAGILARLPTEISGLVKLIFQPNEEDSPSGALAMLDDGVMDDPPVNALVALHVAPEIPSGVIGIRTGPLLAEARDFEVHIKGQGGHGAHPHRAIDAIVVAAHFVSEVQSIVSRRVDPLQSAVISVGEIHGGQADNVIADLVKLRGTVRALDHQLGDGLVGAVEDVLLGVTRAAGAEGVIRWTQGCEVLNNDAELAEAVRRATIQLSGPESVKSDIPQSMGGDDFAYFLRRAPGVLFQLGTNDGTERTSYPLHHPRFDIDEKALAMGAAVLALVAMNLLRED
jgi:amidohydrolase